MMDGLILGVVLIIVLYGFFFMIYCIGLILLVFISKMLLFIVFIVVFIFDIVFSFIFRYRWFRV